MSSRTVSLFARARDWQNRIAIETPENEHTYRELWSASQQIASTLLNGAEDLQQARVAFLVPPSFDYVAVQWGIWRAGGVAVPLAVSHPLAELEYVIEDCEACAIISHPDFIDKIGPLAGQRNLRILSTTDLYRDGPSDLPELDPNRKAMILYTSGTTSKPKGVVTTHRNIEAQVRSLVQAWEWSEQDRILLVLPLHHVHGIVNVLTCALWSGATCVISSPFDAATTWDRFIDGNLTLFMAVPTIYARLITEWERATPSRRRLMSEACAKMRLMVSGSAALPLHILVKWQDISGHVLLERYGMTEIGMALSNPLHGPRVPGYVGTPLPDVEVRLVDDKGLPVPAGTAGEIEVKGPGVFVKYWRRPEATAAAFRDGWFRTGDVAVVEDGKYRILGRNNVDIIKSGGYKVSAIEVEEVLRTHPDIVECAVVGVEDPHWGERVSAALVPTAGCGLSLEALRLWGRERLAPYKLPARIMIVDDLPRNAMGKVAKTQIKEWFKANSPEQ